MIRNLGQVAAIYIGSSQPTNTNLIWLDNTVVPYAFRAYDGSTWSELATRDWVKMFVDGWLVSLPPSTQAGDTDYLLINSNNVNYKITVKEFVKSAVGNPLDFKGVIRTDADFPNPANCEAGDMYVIITSPAGGTVTDPYSGQVFEDTEKIVWDEVTKSWASLGKIEINVDLSTDYSATNVTINSSAGKSTTIEAASTSLAGVMLPQQVKRLTYLSNGSTVPGDPSELDPDTPAHKHNYGDILDRLISQQETGDSTFHPMSQKATTDNLDLKFDKANVVQVQGAATDMVMSQKAVTDAITTLDEWIKEELTKYLKLAGGTMTGNIILNNDIGLRGKNTDGSAYNLAKVGTDNIVQLSSSVYSTRINSKAEDLIHGRNGSNYKIWDAYNLPDPATLSGNNTFTGKNTFNGITNINNSFVLANSKALQGKNVAGTLNYAIGQVNANNNVEVGDTRVPLMLVSNASNLIHYRGTTTYGIWDAYNLPDPAAKSADNVFTGTNTFTAGKFNVGPFNVTATGSLLIDMVNTGGWERGIMWSNNSAPASRIRFGSYGNADVAEFAWIGVGDVQYNTAQYRFYGKSMRVPSAWSLDDAAGSALVWTQSTQLAHFGRAMGTTKIRSGAVDLIHTKGTTDYKILDESNYSQYLPTTNKWTYGFVGMQVGSGNQDLNTILNGDDNVKALLNYYQIGALTNAPTGMGYGSVFQLYTNAFTSYGSEVLKPQLAFDVNHNVAGSTRYMYFRTPNNLGYGDSSNWKRVVTADEKPAGYVLDKNSYPALKSIEDGTTLTWLRAPQSGFIPFTAVNIANGGSGSLGTSTWTFKDAYIANVYANKFITSGGSSSQFLKGNGSLDSTAYLPLIGGTVSGSLTISPVGSAGFVVNNADTAGVDVIQTFRVKGKNKFLLGWSNSGGGAFIQRSDNNRAMILKSDGLYTGSSLGSTVRVATLTDLGSYLPLTGGCMTGLLVIAPQLSHCMTINNTTSGGKESYLQIQIQGTSKAAIGFLSGSGSYIHNYEYSKYLFVKSDGAYFGTPSSNVKLLTTADNVITAVGGENYVNVSLSEAARTSAGAAKYLEWYDGTPGWYNFRIGGLVANGILQSNSANKILQYYHNSAYHDAISINRTAGVGYLMIGNYSSKMRTFLLSNASDILHHRSVDGSSGTGYRMWDGYNLDKPLRYASGGTAGNYTSVYDRNLGVNGNNWTFLSATNAATTSIYAPTSAGTSGQILKSSGTGAPVWANVSTIMEGYVKSTSTKKVTDIQVVDALPATQASGVLYLVVK